MTYEDLRNEALAALSAGADEQTFGASSHASPELQKTLRDSYPKSAMTGRILSYLPAMLAGTGEERLAVRGAEMAPSLLRKLIAHMPQELINKGADRLAKSVPVLAEKAGENTAAFLAKSAVRGGAAAATSGTGNALARQAVQAAVPGETGDKEKPISDLPQDAAWQAGMGAVMGPLASLLQKSAPSVYTHPGLIKKFKEGETAKTAKQLLKEGVYGGKGTFRERAQGLKSGIEDVTNELMPRLQESEQAATQEVAKLPPAHPDMEAFEEIPMAKKIATERQKNQIQSGMRGEEPIGLTSGNMGGYAEDAQNAMIGADEGKKAAMGRSFAEEEQALPKGEYGETNLGAIEDRLKEVNTRVKKMLSDREKGRAFGDEGGQLAAERERLLAIQNAHNQTVEKGVGRFGDLADKKAYRAARGEYRQGADLEGALNDYSRKEMSSSPHIGHNLGRTVLNHTINTLPVRTGLGVLLDRLSPEVAGTITGRAMDYHQRANVNPYKNMTPAELEKRFSEKNPAFVTDEAAPEEENPYLKPETKQTEKTSGNPYLDLVNQ